MNQQMKTLLFAGFSAVAMSFPVNAAIVTQWTATNTATWLTASPGVTITPLLLSWGTDIGSGQSSLAITNAPSNQTVNTFVGGGSPPPAFTAPSATFTHHNVPITASPMTGATVHDTLTLAAAAPPGPGPGLLPPIDFNIAFVETTNTAPCGFPSVSVCDDIFVLLGGFFNQSFSHDSDGAGGDPSLTYFVNIFPTSGGVLSILPDATCAAVHAANPAAPATGCFGFTTPENATTNLSFGYTISTLPLAVPEPATLALLGLGLIALAASRRRRQ